jgi:hypothetical protein
MVKCVLIVTAKGQVFKSVKRQVSFAPHKIKLAWVEYIRGTSGLYVESCSGFKGLDWESWNNLHQDAWLSVMTSPLSWLSHSSHISHPSAFLCLLAVIIMVIFPCFFSSSAVFGKLGEVSKKEDKPQSQFNDPASRA